MLGLMEIPTVRVEANNVDEGVNVVVQECVSERKHGVNGIWRWVELSRCEVPVVREELPVGAIMRGTSGSFISEECFQIFGTLKSS